MTEYHPNDLLPAYILGSLEPDEQEKVQRHLQQCVVCKAEAAKLENVSTLLASAVPAQKPRPVLRERVLKRCQPQQRLAWFDVLLDHWPRLVPTLAVGSLAICFMAGVSSLLFWFASTTKSTDPFAQLQVVTMTGTQTATHAAGRLLVAPNSTQGLLIVYDLPPLSADLQYQLWLIRDGQRANGGVFSVAEDGSGHFQISASQPLIVFDSFGVTIEPYGGSAAPTGQKVMEGRVVSGLLGIAAPTARGEWPNPLKNDSLSIDIAHKERSA